MNAFRDGRNGSGAAGRGVRPGIRPKPFQALATLLAALLLPAGPARAARCGTALYFEKAERERAAGAPRTALAKRVRSESGYPARTLVSDRFLFHYSLRSWHRVHLGTEDSLLVRVSDSLYAAFGGLGADARDSAVYAGLDAAGIPHPAFVLKLRQYFEAAHDYYVGKLGMKAPSSQALSVHYSVDPSLPRRFPVDVVDVGTADPDYAGETYAITYPPGQLSISFENDFLCFTTLDPQGRIRGTHIASRLDGRVIHDYAEEWELGIKVTAFHEYYHAVQFTYNPRVQNYHAWYEISATGMEERNAPEVDDYLQYLPCVLRHPDEVSLTSGQPGPCTHYPMYGHAIFHQYLTRALDSAFDVKVWERLSANGDKLPDALLTAASAYGRAFPALYAEYAAEDFFAGKRFAAPAPASWSTGGLYSDDFPKWPDLAYDSLDLSADPYRMISLQPLTFAVIKVKGAASAPARVLQASGALGFARIHASADTSIVEFPGGSRIELGPPRAGFGEYYLVLPNTSFTDKAYFEFKDADAAFFAFPNPVRAASGTLYFAPPGNMEYPATLRIYGESGKLVRTLGFAGSGGPMEWDLKNEGGSGVKPGLYYYRLGDGAVRPLVVLR